MTELTAVLTYLVPPPQSFWAWSDNDQSLCWRGGETIAFRPEAAAVLQRLCPTGPPPFSAVVLLLAATRDGWAKTSHRLSDHARNLADGTIGDSRTATGVTLRAIGHRLEKDVAAVIAKLDRVAALPGEFRHPVEAKAELAAIVFDSLPNALPADVCAAVVSALHSSAVLGGTHSVMSNQSAALRELVDTIGCFGRDFSDIEPGPISLRLRTGLDTPVRPADEDLSPGEKVRRLLDDLTDDPTLGGLVRLSRELLAAVRIPRHLRREFDVPVGGVADMTNHGPLDRLLVSELANDDLTLAVRVASNEALYLQRESPPRQPPQGRSLVIDAGIRTWGLPRVFAAAAALAVSATGDADAFRPDGFGLVLLDLTTRAGLEAHLEALDPRPHFGLALPAVAALGGDVILITHQDVLDDPAFRLALSKLDGFRGYAVGLDRDGGFRLWALSPSGRTLVRQAAMNLDKLLADPQRPTIKPPLETPSDLPLILSVTPFPLRPPPLDRPKACALDHDDGIIEVTGDGRLLHWDGSKKAAVTLVHKLRRGRLKLLAVTEAGKAIVVIKEHRPHGFTSWHRLTVDLKWSRHSCTVFQMNDPPDGADTVALHSDLVYLIGKHEVKVYRPTDTRPAATVRRGGFRWLNGRVFSNSESVHVLAFDGSKLVFESAGLPVSPIPSVFEGPTFDGLQNWPSDGKLSLIGRPGPVAFSDAPAEPLRCEGVSPDGRRLLASYVRNQKLEFVISSRTTWVLCSTDHGQRFLHTGVDLRCAWRAHNVRTRLSGVAVDAAGRLLMYPRGTRPRALFIDPQSLQLQGVFGQSLPAPIAFEHFPLRRRPGYHLKVAVFKDGSRAFLDSRGMLHLKSADRLVPEITIILHEDGVAA